MLPLSIIEPLRPIVSPIVRKSIIDLPVPSWVAQDANLDLNFEQSRFWWNNQEQALSGITVQRATTAWEYNSSGAIVSVAANVARRWFQGGVYEGIWVNHSRANFLTQSAAPANQTQTLITGRYCLWALGTGTIQIAAGTGVATGLGTIAGGTHVTVYAGQRLQFEVTTAGTFNFTVTGSLTHIQCERENSTSSINCEPGPPIVTTTSSVTVPNDNVILTGLNDLNSLASSWLIIFRQLGLANFPRLVSPGRTNFETSGSSTQQLLCASNTVHYAAVMGLFPSNALNTRNRLGASFQTGTSVLTYNGSQFGTSTAYIGASNVHDALGIGVSPTGGSANFCGVISRIVGWNFAVLASRLLASGG